MKKKQQRITIIYLANTRLPTEKAHGVQIIKMCEALADLGCQVKLIVPRRIQSNPKLRKVNIKDYYRVRNNFTIEKVFAIDLLPLERWRRWVGNWAFLILEGSFTVTANVLAFFRSKDLVFSRSKAASSISMLLGQPTVFESHESAVGTLLNKHIAKHAKRVIAITKPIQRSWEALGAKTIYAPDGVSEEFFKHLPITKARREVKLPHNATIIGYVGNLHTMGKEKGIRTLLEALKLLCCSHPSIMLYIVGGPQNLVERYREFSRKENIEKWITFTGHIPFNKITHYLQAMDILVMPFPKEPHFAYNASPLKLFEYMASQRPIVTSDLPSLREILDEETAILVEPGDPRDLAKGIQTLIGNPKLSQKLAMNAMTKAKQYTWIKRAERILESIR